MACLPLAIGIAILRYRLYEIDRIVSRTVSYGAVTALLVAVFAGVNLALEAMLASMTQAGTLAVAASTLVVFALFQPLRRRVQGIVDHRFNRERYEGRSDRRDVRRARRGVLRIRGRDLPRDDGVGASGHARRWRVPALRHDL
jgi:hypothetical protein